MRGAEKESMSMIDETEDKKNNDMAYDMVQ